MFEALELEMKKAAMNPEKFAAFGRDILAEIDGEDEFYGLEELEF